ncbi:PH domain-containing protein [Bacillus sp. T3]|uniref:PH domain-containing protein n=1 Tax=Bacillus sp. T3 TaxID=467262 RepID=UPI0029816DC9|nr:PH domain-containing protein [Bacillus sp. T3]
MKLPGIYGDEWLTDDIVQVQLMEKMPEVTFKQNGFGLPTLAKGYFKVKNYGTCLLFIKKDVSPYLYIELKNKKIFINHEDPDQTRAWYKELHNGL